MEEKSQRGGGREQETVLKQNQKPIRQSIVTEI
jgi:hypothetical protein